MQWWLGAGLILILLLLAFSWPIGLVFTWAGSTEGTKQGKLTLKLWGGILPLRLAKVPVFIKKSTGKPVGQMRALSLDDLPQVLTSARFKELIRACRSLIPAVQRCLVWRRLEINITGGTKDAALTGQIVGYYWALAPSLVLFIQQWPWLEHAQLRCQLTPVFADEENQAEFLVDLTVYPLLVLSLGIKTLLVYRRIKRWEGP